jgi:hypothetical protein
MADMKEANEAYCNYCRGLSSNDSHIEELTANQVWNAGWVSAINYMAALKPSHNSDYAVALKVFNEWFFNYRGASHNTGDFCEWLDKRLHLDEPNVA